MEPDDPPPVNFSVAAPQLRRQPTASLGHRRCPRGRELKRISVLGSQSISPIAEMALWDRRFIDQNAWFLLFGRVSAASFLLLIYGRVVVHWPSYESFARLGSRKHPRPFSLAMHVLLDAFLFLSWSWSCSRYEFRICRELVARLGFLFERPTAAGVMWASFGTVIFNAMSLWWELSRKSVVILSYASKNDWYAKVIVKTSWPKIVWFNEIKIRQFPFLWCYMIIKRIPYPKSQNDILPGFPFGHFWGFHCIATSNV